MSNGSGGVLKHALPALLARCHETFLALVHDDTVGHLGILSLKSQVLPGQCDPQSIMDNSMARRRTTIARVSFIDYCKVAAKNFEVFSETFKRTRKRTPFHSSRLVQKTVDKLANRIVGSKAQNAGGRSVILFGNGSFSGRKEHASAPRKKIRVFERRVFFCRRVQDVEDVSRWLWRGL